MLNFDPIGSLFAKPLSAIPLTPCESTGLLEKTLPNPVVGGLSVNLASLNASGSTTCLIGSSCGCFIS